MESWLCSLTGSRFSHYFILIPLSDNRNSKIYEKSFIDNLAASKYSIWAQRDKQMHVQKKWAALCANT